MGLVSNVVSITNLQLLYQVVISLKLSPESIINSILCTPKELSFIGTSEKVWKKENSLKPEKILPPLRKIMKKSESKLLKEKVKTMKKKHDPNDPEFLIQYFILNKNFH